MTGALSDKRMADIGKALDVTDGPTLLHEIYAEAKRARAEVADLQAEIVAHEVHAKDQDETNADLTGALDDIGNRDRSDFATLAEAVEQLHHQAHGDAGLRVCRLQPCAGLHHVLPNALGKLIAT
jgi:hypothetical protein